ncbi:MAG: hypothetical protein QOJ97_1381 [Solirubrobacteraceae bacterium]|nr:hypothetical protein [Solirubrobacteraceae bacterium]
MPKAEGMDQVSRPIQFLLIGVLAFAALWFVALRPKTDSGGAAAPPPAAAAPAPAKSSLPGGLGTAVDKARTTQAQGNAAAAAQSGTTTSTLGAAPAPAPAAAKPATTAAKPRAAARPAKPRAATPVRRRAEGPGPTPAKVRRGLAQRHAVVLLFYSAASSDDRAVRSELAGVSRRGGRVDTWAIPVSALSRFANVLQGVQVFQTPSVVVLSSTRKPMLLAGYTDRAEIDQVANAALRRR